MIKTRLANAVFKSQLGISLVLGSLSALLSFLVFSIPGVDGTLSELREVPLLISFLYIKNPIYFLVASGMTALQTPSYGSTFVNFSIHAVSLTLGGMVYNRFQHLLGHNLVSFIMWFGYVITLYLVLYLPILILLNNILLIDKYDSISSYFSILSSIRFEVFLTALITGLFMIQFKMREALEIHQQELANKVDHRITQIVSTNKNLMKANKELIQSNESIKILNKNLDALIKKRTDKVREQLDLLIHYAHLNSTEIQVPLTEIMKLITDIVSTKDTKRQQKLMLELELVSRQMDDIIRNMNHILSSDMVLRSNW